LPEFFWGEESRGYAGAPPMSVLTAFEQALAARGFEADASQRQAALRLERLYQEWVEYKSRRSNAVTRLLVRPPIPRGVYLWGGVGRGKSFLMDAFFGAVPLVRKSRTHFHEFMRDVHRQMAEVKGETEPLDRVGFHLARRTRLICLDEFHVTDIADAMILHRLLARLFHLRVGFVITSNEPPDGLYPDGLQRDRLLPAIELLKEQLDVIQVDGGIDYRLRAMRNIDRYITPLDESAERRLQAAFARIAEVADGEPVLRIEGRTIRARRRAGGIVWFDFAELCGGPRSYNDYLEIASQFHTVILSDVPRLSAAQSSEARRLTWLIDILYDRRVQLIVSAAVPPAELYLSGALRAEFQRTASRLIEMQSEEYSGSREQAATGIGSAARVA
jgi:cell division protein ZapE